MSGCCGSGPVLIGGPQPARVDVETVLLCDVLPDGTVAAQVLVEPIYDTNTGQRIATRTVDPVTGSAYTVQGELQQCAAASTCPDCQTHILCDITEVTTPGETPERITNGHFAADASGWTLGGSARYVPSSSPDGSVGFLDLSPDNQAAGSAEQTTTVTPGLTYNLSARIGIWSTGGTTPQSVLVEVLDGSGTVLYSETVAPADVSGGPLWPADGVVGPVPIVATDTTMTVRFTDQVGGDFIDALVDDVSLLGPGVPGEATTQAQPFMRHVCRDCQGAVTITDTELDGTTVYAVQGTVGTCPVTEESACASSTTPVTSIGLCLADGTPIAVTAVRDCDGVTTSEGWLNLTTGAWTAGAVPVGTVACGDSRSIQVSGTFCDVDADGEVVGLVLVEYTYDDSGAISDVRLVDAVTGGTYTPTGTVTVCPAPVQQPEQDAVILCHTAPDGTVTEFLRDFRRDENGAIVAHSDYTLDGAPYVPNPAGTVGVCAALTMAEDCEVIELCDVQRDVSAVLPAFGTPDEQWQTLPNGVRWMKRGLDTASTGGWYTAAANTPERFDFERPVSIRYSVRFTGPTAAPLRIPDGWYLDSIVTVQHTWDPVTRTISPTASVTQAGESVFRIDALTAQTMIAPVLVGTQPSGQTSQYGQITVTTDQVTPFLRKLCQGSDGTVTTTDTTLDGVTAYTVTGTAGTCPEPPPSSCTDCETLLLCDNGTDDPATITGQGVSSGTLTNGVAWAMRGSAAPIVSKVNNADGAWFGKPESFPNASIPPYTVMVDRPSIIEFSVYMLYRADWGEPDDNCWQLPQGVQPVSLPPGFAFDPVTSRVCATAEQTGDPCTNLTNPTRAVAARFRTNGPVTSLTTRFLGVRYAMCGQFQSAWVGAYEVTPTGQFLRHVCRNCDGTVTSIRDTGLDGVTPYTPLGAVGQCEPDLVTCETLTLCDITPGPDQWAMVQGTANPETLSNGIAVTWTRNIPAGAVYPDPNMRTWLPTASALTSTLSTSKPAQVRIGVSLGAGQQLTLPPGTEVQALSPHHSYVPATRVLTAAATSKMTGDESGSGNNDAYITTIYVPRVAGSVAFTAATVGAGVGFDNIEAAPAEPYSFLQTTCRTAAGEVVGITATELDGVTPYTPLGTVGTCLPSDCCKPVQVCVAATTTESLEFISNAANATDNSVDPTWKWSPALAGPWYDMYRTPPVGGWTTQDGGTPGGTAHWVSAHPNGSPVQSSPPRPNEGPTIGVQTWYARASFNLPEAADPASIRIASTVLNADQNLVAWRLNAGAWQPVGADHTEPPTVFGPTAVPGVKPGTNEIFLEIQETVAGGGGAALMVHLIASYQLPDGQRSWTRMVCCDDTVYYLDETGERHEELPEFWAVAPCGTSAEPIVLCDDAGAFLRHVSYEGGQVVTADTDLSGGAYTPVGTVRSCSASSTTGPADAPVSTGIRRVTGTAPQDLKAEVPGLQSVSVTVLTGVLNVTMSTGAAQAVPAGMTLTWSVADTDDSSLAAASFTGASAATDYVLNWTAKGSAAG